MKEKLPKDIRVDHRLICEMIEPDLKVLDLGCGDGELLSLLIKHKGCRGTGIEINEHAIYKCVAKGLTVSHADINSGLSDYSDGRFDYVILNESLQEVLNIKATILEALRVGKKVVVGVPNFCHFSARLQLFFNGRVPVTEGLPYQWYDTPNLRFFSIKDFRFFCKENNISIEKFTAVGRGIEIKFLRNLFAHIGIFLLTKH
ncbi:MAG: methionine biosynthesis protein MetW [Candidatus Omnitrophica bacterium]|nr:methionine biosynthesis protein MetW [Candidatus Omnitrophota bacterium]